MKKLNKKIIFNFFLAGFIALGSLVVTNINAEEQAKKEKVVHTFTTKDAPEEIVGKLKAGKKYIIREKRAKEGYEKADDYTFTVGTDGSVQEIKIIDKKIKRDVELTKQDTINLKVVPGATVEFENVKTKEKKVATTDKDGKIKIVLTYGEWIYKETIAPEGYVKSDKYGKILVTENGITIEEVLWNKPIESEYILTKKDTVSLKTVPGAEVEIKNVETNEAVFKGKTDDNGQIKVKLRYGKYILTETIAPEGYVKAEKSLEINVTEDGAIIEQILWNEPITKDKIPTTAISSGVMFNLGMLIVALGLGTVVLVKRAQEK